MTAKPLPSFEMLELKARILARIRAFFMQAGVMEVDVPVMYPATATDPHLDSFEINEGELRHFLLTSPEYPMKRLLAGGSGDIYSMAKSFRRGETGARHNPEFIMLEWYRLGYSLAQLMAEVEALVCSLLHRPPAESVSYRRLFIEMLSIDPMLVSLSCLQEIAEEKAGSEWASEQDRDILLDLLMSHCIEPGLGFEAPLFVVDYPASQAALAKIETRDGVEVAARFELYVDGMEIANGYDELADSQELLQRFNGDNEKRRELDLPQIPLDNELLDVIGNLPPCSGVAMGVDRLVMIAGNIESIDELLSVR